MLLPIDLWGNVAVYYMSAPNPEEQTYIGLATFKSIAFRKTDINRKKKQLFTTKSCILVLTVCAFFSAQSTYQNCLNYENQVGFVRILSRQCILVFKPTFKATLPHRVLLTKKLYLFLSTCTKAIF